MIPVIHKKNNQGRWVEKLLFLIYFIEFLKEEV